VFRLTEDVMQDLLIKHPETNIRRVVHDIIDCILEKTLKDGCSKITEFGKFESYKTYSTKLAKEVIRFKFRISPVLEKKIKFDEYLINNAPIKAKVPFTKKHLEKCNQEIKQANIEAGVQASRLGNLRNKEKEMQQIVMDILEDNDTD
jgi:hypothetical protein